MHLPGSFPYDPLWMLTVIFFVALIAARELGAFLHGGLSGIYSGAAQPLLYTAGYIEELA